MSECASYLLNLTIITMFLVGISSSVTGMKLEEMVINLADKALLVEQIRKSFS